MRRRIEPLLTVADLDSMPDDGNRYEIIDGELFVSRSPSLEHQRVSGNIFLTFGFFLRDNPIGEIISTPGVIFSDHSAVIPDLVYISQGRRQEIAAGRHVAGAPDLVIEIVSPGGENEHRDRFAKRQLYAKYGVKEYWLVVLETRTIECYVLDEETLKLLRTFEDPGELTSALLPGFSGSVASIFRT
jgi:Uma2 family endonuclease